MIYYDIEADLLLSFEGEFSVDLYTFDPRSQERFFIAVPGTEFTDRIKEEIQLFSKKGACFQIKNRDFASLPFEKETLDKIEEHNKERIAQYEAYLEREKKKESLAEFSAADEFSKAVESNNFTNIVERVREEINFFSRSNSSYNSSLIELVRSCLSVDGALTKGACLCYFLSKRVGLKDEGLLLEILLAYYLKDIGVSQVLQKSDDWNKHPLLSENLLQRLSFPFSDEFLRLVSEHHERGDGEGFPKMKKREYIHPGSEVLYCVDSIFTELRSNEGKGTLLTAFATISAHDSIFGKKLHLSDNLKLAIGTLKS